MKRCSKCAEIKPFEAFSIYRRSRDGRQPVCKSCKRRVDNQHYAERSDRRRAIRISNDRQLQIKYQWLNDYKSQSGCADCGETDPDVLDFDHLGNKTDNVSTMVRRGLSVEIIQKEIEKCEVVCANDHRRRTKARRSGTRGGAPHS